MSIGQVIIPTAKIVGENLQKIGKLPAVIYPINTGIVFDYLYKQYSKISGSINVMCFENANKVHSRLENYHNEKIHVIDLPELSDLAYTIYEGIQGYDDSVIINFGDTIVLEDSLLSLPDSFYYTEDFKSDVWTFYDIDHGVITNVLDKSTTISGNSRGKLFVGVFHFSNAKFLKKCLEWAFTNTVNSISSFYVALIRYSEYYPLTELFTNNWFDIGHIDKYYNSKLEVSAREFNHIIIDKDRGILKKSSDDIDKFIGEIKWYLKLPADIEYARPRIFSYSTSYTDAYVSMEYYSYHTVHELFLYGDLTYQQWVDIFSRIRFVCNDFRKYVVRDEKIVSSLKYMYLNKTLQRFEKLRSDERLQNFFEKNIIINNKKYLSLNAVVERIKEVIPPMLYDVDNFCIIHGDLCFSNIMVDDNFSFIKVIDPRGNFGSFDIYGDFRYELAKLFHSVDGKYDFIIKNLFTLKYNLEEPSICYEILDRRRDFDLLQIFKKVFETEIGGELNKIELIESLLFLSMISLHNENFNHQLVMLGTGLDILNRVIDVTVKGD